MIPFALYTAIGNELSNGISSKEEALAFAQREADARVEVVDVYQGSRLVATVHPTTRVARSREACRRPKAWGFVGYCAAVLGDSYAEACAIEEWARSGLRGEAMRVRVSEWLGESESLAWASGAEGRDGAPMPPEWAAHHAKALSELLEAVDEHRAWHLSSARVTAEDIFG